ncbi:MAG: adenylosuccinate synthase [Anaerolineaceae bacterium]|nr:MAG: adenylosuccinate synthase [Anaerolineaceae bacterium]
MALQIIVGAQWGDEGKGRIVDWFAANADFTARYNGGDNAGHTVTVGETIFKLHLVPSGIIHPKVVAVMGNGMVVNPQRLLEEMEMLAAAGIGISPARLRISYAAHIITPAHQALDRALEAARGKDNIGTTGRGIGPAYTDKATRRGLRVADLLAADFSERLAAHLESANAALKTLGAAPLEIEPILTEFTDYVLRLTPYVADTAVELDAALRAGKTILAEGAQGTLLDLDHGTYPFVTSSSTVAPGALTGLGLGLTAARDARVTGVVKAFQTRVGSGPFPTELTGDLALRLRGTGEHPWDEYGTTTGRPRRVGWLDGVLLRYAARLNGFTELAVTKLDILSGLETLNICTAYRPKNAGTFSRDEKLFTDLPFGPADLAPYEPVYEELPGWKEDVSGVRKWDDLPSAARDYLDRVAGLAGVPVRLVSVGPEREQIVNH